MGRRSHRRANREPEDEFDEFDEYSDDFDMDDLSQDIYSTDWGDDEFVGSHRSDARRKIERRRDMKRLYSELDDWGDWD